MIHLNQLDARLNIKNSVEIYKKLLPLVDWVKKL